MSATFVADESIDRSIVDMLRQANYAVAYVTEMTPGITDEVVLQEALQRSAILLTADKDFGELVYRQQRANNGVVLIRLAGLNSTLKAEIVINAIKLHASDMAGAFTVITPGTVRIRRP